MRHLPLNLGAPGAAVLAACLTLTVVRPARSEPEPGYFKLLYRAYGELLAKDYAAAAADYGRAAKLLPRSIEALLGEQQALLALGRFADAEPVARAILERDADNYLATSRLAWTLFNLKRYKEAADVYTSVLELYPGDLEMMVGLGYSELRAGRKPAAAVAFRTALAISPKHPRARTGLAQCR
ncbi:MAG TPA: tetratricopeptide repeat protein [Polyangiaceae bacterium]|jgi:tetratricopeptide (TPR) repeat protein|nr:tetratricopeptide repeat protein [Polyangiaceae bacterium]